MKIIKDISVKQNVNLSFLKYALVSITILLFLFLYTPSILLFIGDSNQGAQLSKAQEILHGFHPFVDIIGNVYGPLVFYMSAIGQLLSDSRIIGEIFIIIIGYFSAYFLLYYLMERISNSLVISYLLLVISLSFLPNFYKYYIVLAPVFVLFSIYYFIFKEKDSKGTVLLGISIGISILFRFDFGVYSFIVGLIAFYFSLKDRGLKAFKKDFIYFITTVFFVTLPFLLFLIINNRFPKAIIETFGVVVGMSKGMDLPVPIFNFQQSIFSLNNNISIMFWFFRIFPLLMLVLLFIFRKRVEHKEILFILLTSLFSILIFIQALNRPHIFHTLQAIPIQFVLISWIFGFYKKETNKGSRIVRTTNISLILILMMLFIPFVYNNHLVKKFLKNFKTGISNYEQFFLAKENLREKYKRKNGLIKIADFMNRRTKKDESVLFIPVAPQLYYFSERVFKTSLGVLGPGRLTTKEKQSTFFRELIDTNTNVIVDFYEFSYDKIAERNPRYYYPYLMNLIYSNYKIVRKFGNRILLCRDNRFDNFLINKLPTFKKMIFEENKFVEKKINVKVHNINTWPLNKIDQINIPKNGVLFCEFGFSQLNSNKKYLLGLLKEYEVYFTRIEFKKRRGKNILKGNTFSSTSLVPTGVYEIIIFFQVARDEWNYHKIPMKILIKE